MRKILSGQDEYVAKWMLARCPDLRLDTPYTALGLMNEAGILLAGVLYDNYLKESRCIQLHVAALPGARWLCKRFLGEGFRYPFEQLGCRRITGLVRSSNTAARTFDEHLGFVFEGRIRHNFPNGDDLIIYGMLREECRYLNVGRNHGRRHTFVPGGDRAPATAVRDA